MMLSPELIESNWKKFLAMCSHVGDHRRDAVIAMCESMGERLALAPASARYEHHNAFPGGLVDHSLRVLLNASTLSKTMGSSIEKHSLVMCSLMHDLGKVGYEDASTDYYVVQDSDWHRDKLGAPFKVNSNILYMPHAHRSIYLLQSFSVQLTAEEFVAILTHDGQYVEENRSYACKEPMLATVIATADYLAMKQEKELFAASKQQNKAASE